MFLHLHEVLFNHLVCLDLISSLFELDQILAQSLLLKYLDLILTLLIALILNSHNDSIGWLLRCTRVPHVPMLALLVNGKLCILLLLLDLDAQVLLVLLVDSTALRITHSYGVVGS